MDINGVSRERDLATRVGHRAVATYDTAVGILGTTTQLAEIRNLACARPSIDKESVLGTPQVMTLPRVRRHVVAGLVHFVAQFHATSRNQH